MIDSVAKDATSLLDRRFVLNAFLPVAILVPALFAVAVAPFGGFGRTITWYDKQPGTAKWLIALGLLAFLVVVAALLSSVTPRLVSWYEGYWTSPPGRWVARVGRGWHRSKLDKVDYDEIYQRYPLPTQPEQVMPTTLGNVLRNAELYPRDRYGADAVIVWPRLYPLLPDQMVARLAAARADLDFLIVVSALAALFTPLSGSYLLATSGPWWLFTACTLGGTTICWLTYRASIRSAIAYAHQVKAAFDLYRLDLLAKLGITAPDDLPAERLAWQKLVAHWYRNIPAALEDATPEPAEPAVERALLPLRGWFFVVVVVFTAAGAISLAV